MRVCRPIVIRDRSFSSALRRVLAALSLVWVAGSSWTAPAADAQTVNQNFYVTNGPVAAELLSGNTLYIAGNFTSVGPATGGGVPINDASGQPVSGFPKVAGYVYSVVSDGSGGWFIGGAFYAVGGVARSNLAHVRADNTIDSWNPAANGNVFTLALSGGTIYAGGDFSRIGGAFRLNVAALDAATGLATAWDPAANDPVFVLTASGGNVYAGGAFSYIGGQPRRNIGALSASTGLATDWDPDADNYVYALLVNGETVYTAGYFSQIGWRDTSEHGPRPERRFVAALDISTGHTTNWNPRANDLVKTLAISGGVVYAGGNFTRIGWRDTCRVGRSGCRDSSDISLRPARNFIAALDTQNGRETAWNPDADGSVFALNVSGGTVYAGGAFTRIGGQGRNSLAALDAATGRANAWNPNLNSLVYDIAVSGATVYAAGFFTSVGGLDRGYIAALDVTTGRATPWNPEADRPIYALAESGGLLYAGGNFLHIGGASRARIAALDAATGLATDWNPGASDEVHAVAVSGGTVYAGGVFSTIGGQRRSRIAALDAATGLATSWNPKVLRSDPSPFPNDYSVDALVTKGSLVFAGGYFDTVGGVARQNLAALDSATGNATAFDPSSNGAVESLVSSGNQLYAGGAFTRIGGEFRDYVAAIDLSNSSVTAWNPGANDVVSALAVKGGTVYAGGWFTSIGGQPRNRIAALNAATGIASSWNPGADYPVTALAVGGGVAYVAGEFSQLGGVFQPNLGAITSDAGSFALSVTTLGSGTVTRSVDQERFADGSTVTLTAIPADGWQFSGWNSGAPAIENPLTVTMDEDKALTARFEQVTAAQLSLFEATPSDEGVLVRWQFSDASDLVGTAVERSADAAGTWTPVHAEILEANSVRTVLDRDVEADHTYLYRLVAKTADGRSAAFGPIAGTAGGRVTEFALVRVSPNPTTDLARVEYTVAREAYVRLSVMDLQGRLLSTLVAGVQKPGRFQAVWNGTSRQGRAQAGVYFVRYETPGKTSMKRILIAR